jgi:SIR2-like domain
MATRRHTVQFCIVSAGVLVAVDATAPNFRGHFGSVSWTLCIGAGISRDISPTWFDLARNIVNDAFGSAYDGAAFEKLIQDSGWNLDAWIQAAANEHLRKGKAPADFADLIEDQLYSNIKAVASGTGLAKHLVRVLNHPTEASKKHVMQVCEFFETNFSNCSLLQLAHFLIEAEAKGKNPVSVLTFNADTLLETLIYLFLRRAHYLGPGPHGHPDFPYRPVQRPSDVPHAGIPICHCHGAITPRGPGIPRPRDSRDRLIFLESEYLKVAAVSASWAATSFLYYAQTSRMVFVGLSMADANIRRWMNAANIENEHDLRLRASGSRVNPPHLWVSRKPSDPIQERIKLAALLHLGIRPAWIAAWGNLRAGLNNLAAM